MIADQNGHLIDADPSLHWFYKAYNLIDKTTDQMIFDIGWDEYSLSFSQATVCVKRTKRPPNKSQFLVSIYLSMTSNAQAFV